MWRLFSCLAPTVRLVVFGEVVGIHIDDDAIAGGRFDPEAQGVIARLGYANYAVVGGTFRMERLDP